MISVLLVEDDELVRAALRLLVERVPDCYVLGEAENGREALLLVEELHPRLVLTDLLMPFIDGISLTREVRRRYPHVAVLILTGYADQLYLTGALNAGASGYILKGSGIDELGIALHAVERREVYVTPRMATARTERISRTRTPLTVRQHQVLQLISTGRTNKEIALFLNVTVKTVDKHRTELMRRLGVHNAGELVRCAIQNDLLPAGTPAREFTAIR